MLEDMTRLKMKFIASAVAGLVVVLLTSGVAEARLAANHNDTVLRDR